MKPSKREQCTNTIVAWSRDHGYFGQFLQQGDI
jgi:hypothetical protein